jgi:putative transposase
VGCNRRNGRPGHVFQGRFKSLLVDEDEYLLPLNRYIHLNPTRTSRFKKAEYAKKRDYLIDRLLIQIHQMSK